MTGDKVKKIFDKYCAMMLDGENIHRYDLEAEFEQMNKKYKNPQVVELLLKKATTENEKYKQLFNVLYGDMPKYGGGNFKL